MIPTEYADDEAFVLASELRHDAAAGTWHVEIELDGPLAGPETDRSLETVERAALQRTKTDDCVRWRGEILVSAGVVTLLNGEIAMIWRDQDAPADAETWQSPAGRCEGPPAETALREFYEELVVIEDGRPAFLMVEDHTADYESEYEAALRRVDRHAPPPKWRRYRCEVPVTAGPYLETVETSYGERTWTDEMLVFFDEDASTLECRFVVSVDVDDPDALELLDGELDRRVERHAPADVVAMDRSELVPMDAHLADTLYPALAAE